MPLLVAEYLLVVRDPGVGGEASARHAHADLDQAAGEAVSIEQPLERDGAHEAERTKDAILGGAHHGERELLGARVYRRAVRGGWSQRVAEGIEGGTGDELTGAAGGNDCLGDEELELRFSDVEPLASAKPCQPLQERGSRSTGHSAPPRGRRRACVRSGRRAVP